MIKFHYKTNFVLKNKKLIKEWIAKVIDQEEKKLGNINYVFCDDKYLLDKNIKYLDHDTFTDIITFNYSEKNIIHADIMISIPRVKENSIIFENSFSEELNRVMVHGVLHLLGWNDKTEKEKKEMKEKEDYYLTKLH